MSTMLILVAVVSFSLNAAMTRLLQLKHPGNKGILTAYQAMYCFTAALLFFLGQALNSGLPGADAWLRAVLPGVAFGAFFFLASAGGAAGYALGSMSLTSIIMNLSLFVPLAYSCLVWGDAFSPLQLAGVLLMVLTVILAVDFHPCGTSLRWLMTVLMAFFANGATAVIQKGFAKSAPDAPSFLFMSIAYLTAAALFLLRSQLKFGGCAPRERIRILPLSVLSGLGSFGGNALLGLLCLTVSGTVLYPCVNGGLCIVSALVSFLCFREPLSRRKILAILTGVIAIVLLNL